MATDLDPRVNPYRPDLAARHLEGRVEAARFVGGLPCRVDVGLADLQSTPEPSAALATQLLMGETFTVYENENDWAWGQSGGDSYVGYVESWALSEDITEPTHLVAGRSACVYAEPNAKAGVLDTLSMNGRVRVTGREESFAALEQGGWCFAGDLAPLDDVDEDFVGVAALFLGVPYVWGGRDVTGIDCSGLVQMALARAGITCPRDSDMQLQALGEPVPWQGADTELWRGDLVFLPGHVAFMEDEGTILHANARDMKVSRHVLGEFLDYVKDKYGHEVSGVRRIER